MHKFWVQKTNLLIWLSMSGKERALYHQLNDNIWHFYTLFIVKNTGKKLQIHLVIDNEWLCVGMKLLIYYTHVLMKNKWDKKSSYDGKNKKYKYEMKSFTDNRLNGKNRKIINKKRALCKKNIRWKITEWTATDRRKIRFCRHYFCLFFSFLISLTRLFLLNLLQILDISSMNE